MALDNPENLDTGTPVLYDGEPAVVRSVDKPVVYLTRTSPSGSIEHIAVWNPFENLTILN